jgi:hypothetical protein
MVGPQCAVQSGVPAGDDGAKASRTTAVVRKKQCAAMVFVALLTGH